MINVFNNLYLIFQTLTDDQNYVMGIRDLNREKTQDLREVNYFLGI